MFFVRNWYQVFLAKFKVLNLEMRYTKLFFLFLVAERQFWMNFALFILFCIMCHFFISVNSRKGHFFGDFGTFLYLLICIVSFFSDQCRIMTIVVKLKLSTVEVHACVVLVVSVVAMATGANN